ncbi:hypothetical protein FRB99_002075 [Tulasnella sp. 403]|nr:hypothetical protein FRB99_002075 [Tulasnella sp. 403]
MALSYVSRAIRGMVLPLLLEVLRWDVRIDDETGQEWHGSEQMLNCLQLLVDKPQYRRHVKELSISGFKTPRILDAPPLACQGWPNVFSLIGHVVPLLDGLRTLELSRIPITLPIYTSFQQVEALYLVNCSFIATDVLPRLDDARPLRMKDLTVTGQEPPVSSLEGGVLDNLRRLWIHLVFSPCLATLHLSDDVIKVLSTLIFSQPRFGGVKCFVLDIFSNNAVVRGMLVNLLRDCEGVEAVCVNLGWDDDGAPIGIEAGSLPVLGVYHGDYRCAEEFITGRPVDHIYLYTSSSPHEHKQCDLQRALRSGTVPVTHLQIEQCLIKDIMPTLATLLPYLQTLEIRVDWPIGYVQVWEGDDATESISQMRYLQGFTYFHRFYEDMNPSLEEERNHLQIWEAANASLWKVSLRPTHRWTKFAPGDWQVAVMID